MEDLSLYNPEGSTLRQAQHRMTYILQEVDKICRRHHIQYFLDGGSLIGAVRHGGFIPWDDDLDIAIMLDDYPKLRRYLEKELPSNLAIHDWQNDPNYPLLIGKVRDKNSFFEEKNLDKLSYQGIYLDIIPMEKVPNHKWKQQIDYWVGHCFRALHNYTTKKDKIISTLFYPFALCMMQITRLINRFSSSDQIAHRYGWGGYGSFSAKDVFPVRDMQFEGISVMVPNNPDAVLTALFGDYMQIPPKEKRPQHAGKIEIYQ